MKILESFLAILREGSGFSKSRKAKPPIPSGVPLAASATKGRLVIDSLSCPYCLSQKFVRRGWRQKKIERVQLYLCQDCGRTFTAHLTKGKHYPLAVMLDAISTYNLGYSLEETCRIINQKLNHQKIPQSGNLVRPTSSLLDWPLKLAVNISQPKQFVKSQNEANKGVDLPGVAPGGLGLRDQSSERARPTPKPVYQMAIQPSTLSNWLKETEELCKFKRMREYAVKKYSPADMVITATLAHRQLYRYRFHQAKCELMIQEQFQHRKFTALKEFLEMVLGECPHQYFQEGLRASEVPLTFSKKQMIVRSKQNYATRLCEFVLQSVKDRKQRHEALQKFMLYNDSVTVATEVPVYLTKDDLLHMRTQLGFEIYQKENPKSEILSSKQAPNSKSQKSSKKSLEFRNSNLSGASNLEFSALPKLITGHIDILQIRNGQIHILDYKANAEKEQPIEQLTLYAMALSRLTGLRLFEFKCAWFDEKDYFEFYPLHVLHKPRKGRRRRKVYTMEGIYNVNKDEKKILTIKPIPNY